MRETHLKIALMMQQTWIPSGWNIKWDFKIGRWNNTASQLPFLWYCYKELCPFHLMYCQVATLWLTTSNNSATWFLPSEIATFFTVCHMDHLNIVMQVQMQPLAWIITLPFQTHHGWHLPLLSLTCLFQIILHKPSSAAVARKFCLNSSCMFLEPKNHQYIKGSCWRKNPFWNSFSVYLHLLCLLPYLDPLGTPAAEKGKL